MKDLYTIQANGKTYNKRAWTGGDVPDWNKSTTFTKGEYDNLVEAFYLEQYREYNSKLPLPTDVHEIFLNRAQLDAWRTLNP